MRMMVVLLMLRVLMHVCLVCGVVGLRGGCRGRGRLEGAGTGQLVVAGWGCFLLLHRHRCGRLRVEPTRRLMGGGGGLGWLWGSWAWSQHLCHDAVEV